MNYFSTFQSDYKALKCWSLAVILLLPSAFKVVHTFEYHTTTKDCKIDKAHIHTSNHHNDTLDYFFQPLVHVFHETKFQPLPHLYEFIIPVYWIAEITSNFEIKDSRAPPYFVL